MKTFSFKIDPLTGEEYYEVYLRGQQLIADPLLNKGSQFTIEERASLELSGLLPPGVSNIEEQVARALDSYRRKPDDLERYLYLLGLLNRNETLFYQLLSQNLTEMLPIVYTPTVGQACMLLSRIMRRPRGIYFHPENIANIDRILQAVPLPEVRLMVVTDGERILGLGDLGVDGMGIPVGKVSLYVAAGGVHPACCLPVCLDVGTNNERLLADPLYLGARHQRLQGEEYDRFVERFVLGVKRNFPDALIQWEDFAKTKAFTLLSRYRERVLSFDDDIQGTGATACAALLTAMRIKGRRLADQRFVIVGMGQAGIGTAHALVAVMEEEGLSTTEARRRIFGVDRQGLLIEGDPATEEEQRPLAQPRSAVAGWRLASSDRIDLKDVVRNSGATVLIGYTAQAGLFDAEVLRQMAANDPRPVVLALSNPTDRSECTPAEALEATRGRALIATGSPFDPVAWEGKRVGVSQCNNLYIFPGVGLGALVARASRVTDRMFVEGAKALASMVTSAEIEEGLLLPRMESISAAAFAVARAVAIEARNARLGRLVDDEELAALIGKAQWKPNFYPYRAGTARA
jgi:malate dehydrogenase (oxaloacetate-decarboxylating)